MSNALGTPTSNFVKPLAESDFLSLIAYLEANDGKEPSPQNTATNLSNYSMQNTTPNNLGFATNNFNTSIDNGFLKQEISSPMGTDTNNFLNTTTYPAQDTLFQNIAEDSKPTTNLSAYLNTQTNGTGNFAMPTQNNTTSMMDPNLAFGNIHSGMPQNLGFADSNRGVFGQTSNQGISSPGSSMQSSSSTPSQAFSQSSFGSPSSSNNAGLSGLFGNAQTPNDALLQIHQMQSRQKEHMEKIRQYQKQALLRPQKDSLQALMAQHNQVKESIEQELKALSQLFQNVILSPADLHKVFFLVQELQIQKVQLELYQKELHQLMINPQMVVPICTLHIAEHPFPMVVTKGKQMEDDPITVMLLTGANVEIQSFSKVKVAMVCENHQIKTTSRKAIQNDSQNMDAYRRMAKFYPRFMTGTRKNPVNLRFGVQVQLHTSQRVTVESDITKPFIVITNECQWEVAEGILLKQDAFGDQFEISWPQFANVLQRHFLRATKQDTMRPTRCLSPFDFEYIHNKFFEGGNMISQKAFENFWGWFGKSIQKLRYQRHIGQLWKSGLLYGYLTREGVQQALFSQQVGTFLIRFSERHPGLFAVGYKCKQDPNPSTAVRHYLVRPEDTSGARKTLPDFLRTSDAFQYILQVTGQNEGRTQLKVYPRDSVLSSFYSKRASLKDCLGYDSEPVLQRNS